MSQEPGNGPPAQERRSSALTLMPPPAARPAKRKEVVLEEDEWVAKMEGIIERDFFPELGKLQDKVQWLEAVRSGDVAQIRQAQFKIAQRRAGRAVGATPTPGAGATPWTSAAAASHDLTPGGAAAGAAPADQSHSGANTDIPNVSLDAFLSNHTSEDNASFSTILEHTNKRRRERAALLLAPPLGDPSLRLTDGERPTDGFGTTGQQTDTQIGWKYEPINMLMYSGGYKETLPPSKAELAAMAQGPPRTINHRGTRLRAADASGGIPSASPSTSVDTASVAGSQSSADTRRAASRGGEKRGGNSAYDILATPSFDPGVDASPFMTWGDIEATPMRIEEEDLPPGGVAAATQGGGGGPSFNIKDTPHRESKAHELAAKASSHRRPAPSSLAGRAAMVALGRTERVAGSGNNTPMSAAARRLAGRMKKDGKGGGMDSALRASYRGTPSRHGGGGGGWEGVDATPARGSGWTPSSTPKPRP